MNLDYQGNENAGGIYKITNTNNNKIYIGSTGNFKKRWTEHKSALIRGAHGNRHLQYAYNINGDAAWHFTVLEVVFGKSAQLTAEQICIDKHFGASCYNIMKKVCISRKMVDRKVSLAKAKANPNYYNVQRINRNSRREGEYNKKYNNKRTKEYVKKYNDEANTKRRAKTAARLTAFLAANPNYCDDKQMAKNAKIAATRTTISATRAATRAANLEANPNHYSEKLAATWAAKKAAKLEANPNYYTDKATRKNALLRNMDPKKRDVLNAKRRAVFAENKKPSITEGNSVWKKLLAFIR